MKLGMFLDSVFVPCLETVSTTVKTTETTTTGTTTTMDPKMRAIDKTVNKLTELIADLRDSVKQVNGIGKLSLNSLETQ